MNKDKSNNPTIKDNLKNIYLGLKESFASKEKNDILKSVGNIIYILVFAIIIKVPFLFIKTIVLDFMNSSNFSYNMQNIVSICFEIIYVLVALIVVYKNLKKYFIKK